MNLLQKVSCKVLGLITCILCWTGSLYGIWVVSQVYKNLLLKYPDQLLVQWIAFLAAILYSVVCIIIGGIFGYALYKTYDSGLGRIFPKKVHTIKDI